jgi:hypothetical protein
MSIMAINPTQPYVPFPDHYRLSIHKQGAEDTTDNWYNTYDIAYPAGATPTLADDIWNDFLNYEQTLHYSDVQFVEMILVDYHVGNSVGQSTFELVKALAGGTVGNAPGASNSLAGQGGGPIGGEVCLGVTKQILNRRRGGRNFYRGCLQKNDVAGTAGGEWGIVNNSQFPAQFTAHSLPFIAPHLFTGASPRGLSIISPVRASTVPHVITSFIGRPVNTVQLVFPAVYTNKISRKSRR